MTKKLNNNINFLKPKLSEMKNSVVRTSSYELLRWICALMIILHHVQVHENIVPNWFFTNFQVFTYLPISVFMFLTGFFLANAKKSRFFYILSIIIVYYLLNLIVGYLILHYGNLTNRYAIKSLFFGGRDWWYFWTLPIIYLLSPLINIALKKINRWYSLIVIIIIYILFLIFSDIETRIFGARQLLFLTVVYCLGVWYKTYAEHWGNKKISLIVAILFLLTLQVINNLLFNFFNKGLFGLNNITLPTSKRSFLAILSAIALFVIFQNIKIKSNKVLNFLGKLSLPIYLFHYFFEFLVIAYIMPLININKDLYPSLFALITWILCTGLTVIFSLIILFPCSFLINSLNKFFVFLENKIKKTKLWKIAQADHKSPNA